MVKDYARVNLYKGENKTAVKAFKLFYNQYWNLWTMLIMTLEILSYTIYHSKF